MNVSAPPALPPWRPSQESRVTVPGKEPKLHPPGPAECIRIGLETLSLGSSLGSAGFFGHTGVVAGSALGSGLAGITMGLGLIQVMRAPQDRRFLVHGLLDMGLGATAMAGGLLGGGGGHPVVGVVALALAAARVAYTVKKGSPLG